MKPKRIVMGAAVVGCFAAAMISGVSAQERGNISGHVNARAGGSHVEATSQLNRVPRQGGGHYTNASRMGEASVRREFAEGRAVGGEQRFARVGSEARYGWRGDRWAYRDRSVGVGVAADGYSYGRRPLYAYAPGYDVAYSAVPYNDYAPGYDVAYSAVPYNDYASAYSAVPYNDYAPGYDVAYNAVPYYDYPPGVSVGVGIGPVGIGIGPAWGWW